MKRLLSLSLLTLLLYHTLATVWVAVGVWWHNQRDLSEHLTVYSSVDSLVEFQVVLSGGSASGQAQQLARQTSEDGFAYHDKFYDVVSIELHGDTLRIAGLEDKTTRFWKQDLLSFVQKTISQPTDETSRKAGHWLKLLLKEYQLSTPLRLSPSLISWFISLRGPEAPTHLVTRALSVLAPPPRG